MYKGVLMHEYWHVILESMIDVAKILPFLFIIYYVIELIEFKHAIKLQNSKMLKGEASPIFGSLLGCVPQCGFSVISTDLFNKGFYPIKYKTDLTGFHLVISQFTL